VILTALLLVNSDIGESQICTKTKVGHSDQALVSVLGLGKDYVKKRTDPNIFGILR